MRFLKSAATLTVATVLFLGGAFAGLRLLTAEADTTTPLPTCADRTFGPGDQLTSNLITVNVYNASLRAGLANRVMINLQRRNFLAGTIGNSPSKIAVRTVTILTDDQRDPRVRLVARQFADKVTFAAPDVDLEPGEVTVIVGDDYSSLRRAPLTVANDRELTICLPIVRLS